MQERRRHQRVRFDKPPSIMIGFGGATDCGVIENLSASGLMLRTVLPLKVGKTAGCEFSLSGSPLIDVPAMVVCRVGDLFGMRFQAGPVNQVAIDDALARVLARGEASVLGIHDIDGRKVLRVAGGLNASLTNDFMHALTRVGVHVLDLAAVTAVDQAGLELCLAASARYQVAMGAQSACFALAWSKVLAGPWGGLEEELNDEK